MNYQFRNDYSELASAEILKALNKARKEQNVGYGLDVHSKKAAKLIAKRFAIKNPDVFFVSSGTQANLLVISFLLKDYEAVIACNTGHINVHETGAIENTGHKVLTVLNQNGKMLPEDIERIVLSHVDEHMVKPKMVYLSNSTETGTIYGKDELIKIKEMCDKYGLYLFIDGARMASALTSKYNDVTPEFLKDVCDVFYLGGTKNGLLFGEAIVFVNNKLANEFRYHLKNKGAMLAKTFVVSIMFERAFKDNLYFDLAKNANEMASFIYDNLKDSINFLSPAYTNQLFIELDKKLALDVIDKFGCELWENKKDTTTIRIVTSFATSKEACLELINYLK